MRSWIWCCLILRPLSVVELSASIFNPSDSHQFCELLFTKPITSSEKVYLVCRYPLQCFRIQLSNEWSIPCLFCQTGSFAWKECLSKWRWLGPIMHLFVHWLFKRAFECCRICSLALMTRFIRRRKALLLESFTFDQLVINPCGIAPLWITTGNVSQT